jgi:hypothetical protein
MHTDPRSIYLQLREQRRAAIAQLEDRHRSLGYAKLAVVGLGLILVWMALVQQAFSILWALIPAIAFLTLVIVHDRLLHTMERARRAENYFVKGLARLDGAWHGQGESGDRYIDPEHPYAQDLDLFGKGSVFELLCTARTQLGQDTLAAWLKAPAPADDVRSRQQAVEELRPRIDLREEFAILAEEARTGVHPAALA